MQESLMEDPIAKPVQEFITLFKQELPTVTFPDVTVSILETLATKIRENAQALQEALALAEEARKTLEASQQDLLLKSARGLAYAKVYAEDNAALMESLFKINLGKAARTPKKILEDGQKTAADEKPEEKKQRQPKKAPEQKPDEPKLL